MTTKELLNSIGESLHANGTATVTHSYDCTCITCATRKRLSELYRRIQREGVHA